jgi:glutaminase
MMQPMSDAGAPSPGTDSPPVVPAVNVIERGLGDVLAEYESITEGTVADYIPELAAVDPDRFGIALASVRGRVYSAGDDELAFTIQSSSKPFVYALAIGELGSDVVERHVGFEPSGEPFNAISLDAATGRPDNPLINAGAIVTTSLIPGGDQDARFERIHRFLSACAGHPLGVDETVFRSEHDTGDRNRALAFLARSTGVLGSDVESATSVYFRQCAILVTARDLSVMAATLANNGVNPITGETVMHEDVARATLAVMAMCGMYNSSGEWMVRVGLPAKSGVGGGIVAVKPGQFGVGVFSPRLDARGNSVRGVRVLERLSSAFDLHLMTHPDQDRSAVTGAVRDGDTVRLTLTGEIDFISIEDILSSIASLLSEPGADIAAIELDLTAVNRLRPMAERFLTARSAALRERGVLVRLIDPFDVVHTRDIDAASATRPVDRT